MLFSTQPSYPPPFIIFLHIYADKKKTVEDCEFGKGSVPVVVFQVVRYDTRHSRRFAAEVAKTVDACSDERSSPGSKTVEVSAQAREIVTGIPKARMAVSLTLKCAIESLCTRFFCASRNKFWYTYVTFAI